VGFGSGDVVGGEKYDLFERRASMRIGSELSLPDDA
jgi:hypothetical protein